MILTKICMPPQRRLLSLGSNVDSWWCLNPWAQGWLAPLVFGELPWQGSCRGIAVVPNKGLAGGLAVVPGKDLAGGLVAFLGKDPAEDRRLLILI